MSRPPSHSRTNQTAVTCLETGAATAMKREILHSVDAASFLESAPDAMLLVDEQGRIVAVNTFAEKLFGYCREELIGELIETLVMDRSRNRNVDVRWRDIADPLPWTVGADLGLYGLRKDGKELSIEISLSPLVTPAGRLVLSAIRDFTDIERMKEQVRQRAEELQKVMDLAPMAILVALDPECRNITGNRAANAMSEAEEGASLSFTNFRFFRQGVAVPAKELPMQVAAATGTEVRDWEAEAITPSGARKVIRSHASPLRGATGEVRGAVAAYGDVTAIRQRTEAALLESREQTQLALDSAQLGLWSCNVGSDEIWASEQTLALFGWPRVPNLTMRRCLIRFTKKTVRMWCTCLKRRCGRRRMLDGVSHPATGWLCALDQVSRPELLGAQWHSRANHGRIPRYHTAEARRSSAYRAVGF